MRFSKTFKPELVASTDITRSRLMVVELTREKNGEKESSFLVATNGTALVKVPVEDAEGDVLGSIQPEAFDAARKIARKLKHPDVTMGLTKETITLPDGSTMPRVQHSPVTFPDYARVIPSPTVEAGRHVVLGINPTLLFEVAKALGGEDSIVKVLIEIAPPSKDGIDFPHVTSPMRVTLDNWESKNAVGVVMPGRV